VQLIPNHSAILCYYFEPIKLELRLQIVSENKTNMAAGLYKSKNWNLEQGFEIIFQLIETPLKFQLRNQNPSHSSAQMRSVFAH
jgi:hypothetical protein